MFICRPLIWIIYTEKASTACRQRSWGRENGDPKGTSGDLFWRLSHRHCRLLSLLTGSQENDGKWRKRNVNVNIPLATMLLHIVRSSIIIRLKEREEINLAKAASLHVIQELGMARNRARWTNAGQQPPARRRHRCRWQTPIDLLPVVTLG